MTRVSRFPLLLGLCLLLCGSVAQAQWHYPRGYGGYGFGGWGADPASGYMAGMGAFARGKGTYNLETAKAEAIERESLIKWNQAMSVINAKKKAEQAQQQAEQAKADAIKAAEARISSGQTLNDLLDAIVAYNPDGTKAIAARAPVTPSLVRDIPFVSNTNAITICLDELSGDDAWPTSLAAAQFTEGRNALRAAVTQALQESSKGSVSASTAASVSAAIAILRKEFQKSALTFAVDYDDSDIFLRSLASVALMLRQPDVVKVLGELEKMETPIPVGQLIHFMHTFNLRFGPARSPRQQEAYRELAGTLKNVLTDIGGPSDPNAVPPPTIAVSLPRAARDAFRAVNWEDLDAAQAATP